jgi:hypothetical protein
LKTIAIICVLLLIQGISYAQNNGPFGTNNGDGLRQDFTGQGNYNNRYNNGNYYNNPNQQSYGSQRGTYNQRYSNQQYRNNGNYYAPNYNGGGYNNGNYNRYSTEGGVIFYPQIGVIYNNCARLPLTGFDRNGNELIMMTGSRLDCYNHLENFYYYQMYHPRHY